MEAKSFCPFSVSSVSPWCDCFARAALIAFVVTIATGCASPWEKSFRPNPDLHGQKFAGTKTAQIRTLEPERLKKFNDDEHQRRVNSTTAPVDLSPGEKAAAKDRLFEALQFP